MLWFGWTLAERFRSPEPYIYIAIVYKKHHFQPVLGIILVFLTFIYVTVCVAFALLCGTVFHRPALAITVNLLAWIGSAALAFVLATNTLEVGLMCVYSLNPLSALKMAINDLEMFQRYDTPVTVFERFTYQYTFLHGAIFLFVDAILIIVVTQILDLILPSAGYPGVDFLSIFKQAKNRRKRVGDFKHEESLKLQDGDFEPVSQKTSTPDVEVINLRKRWGYGDYAVNGTSFQAFRGDITALLGHNGAGKSTTFSCLTGYTSPTSGDVKVCGMLIDDDLSEIRKNIGYCPQGNPLFDRLSCLEHLRLAAKLRGSYHGDEDCRHVLQQVGLGDAESVLAEELSGGMKRKLCVAMALVGKSQVVLLDEPTAGMDPTARRQIGDILEKFKHERTIILTTHYMDEADMLSDRILIMVKGKVTCAGSSTFLKNRFGTGFLLTITLRQGVEPIAGANQVLELVRRTIPTAKMDGSPAAQFTLNLPYESKARFVELFAFLEKERNNLGIDSFGLSVNTLEQVFIKVGEKAEKSSSRQLAEKIAENALKVERQDFHRHPNFFKQSIALMWRNYLYMYRHLLRSIVPFFVCLVCFLFLYIKQKDEPKSAVNFDTQEKVVLQTLESIPHSHLLSSAKYFDSISKLAKEKIEQCSVDRMEYDAEKLKSQQFRIPPNALGIFEQGSTLYLMGSPFLHNSLMLAINLFSNLVFGNGKDTNIQVGFMGNSTDFSFNIGIFFNGVMNSVFNAFGLTFGLAMLLSTIISERKKKFKHQLYLASARPYTYWISQFLTDLSYFAVLAIFVFGLSFWASEPNFACTLGIVPIWILYFTASSLASYVMSFAFESPTKGTVFILAFHTIIPMVLFIAFSIAVGVISFVLKQDPSDYFQFGLFFLDILFPAVGLFRSQNTCTIECDKSKKGTDFATIYNSRDLFTPSKEKDFWSIAPKVSLVALGLSILFYLAWLILIESKVIGRIVHKLHIKKFVSYLRRPLDEDYDVAQERERVSALGDYQQSLAVRSLFKFYSESKCAVQDLTFGMAPNECFGLLGVNGAGKTTTFDMLTNQIYPSSGTATILGIPIQQTPPIGYCPQFDALSGSLTGRETLQLLGRLNGFENVDERVRLVLECVMMEEKADKLVKTYSGGQKRRISIACCLMSGSKFLVLDEPTAGVDPATRRHIWDLLIAMRNQNKAILLTTHSMEECEALCTRIGFLRAGRLRGIGSSQHLKSRYGNSYILTLILNDPGQANAAFVDDAVRKMFDVAATDSSPEHSALSWTLPKKAGSYWSQMYGDVERFVNEVNRQAGVQLIGDFYLIQDSLEQVFTRLATLEESQVEQPAAIFPPPPPYNQAANGAPLASAPDPWALEQPQRPAQDSLHF
uniref:ABC transporter domain-containing protein n=1 Tax=Bursaphelenchus xylophilus TaxID=6326 RepID=A0A1I7S9I1_BURXY